MFYFISSLQFQIQLQSGLPQSEVDGSGPTSMNFTETDEIGAALSDLQSSLEGSSISTPGDITHIPELADEIRFFK